MASGNYNEPVRVLRWGYKSVGTSPEALMSEAPGLADGVKNGILLKAPSANSNTIFVSTDPGVTNNNDETGGLPIDPGTSEFIPIETPEDLYVVSGGSGQHLKYMIS